MSTNQLDAQSAELQEDQGGPWVGAPRSALLMIEEGVQIPLPPPGHRSASVDIRRPVPATPQGAVQWNVPLSPSPRALLAGTTRSFVWLCSDAPRAD
jgi:hypothetical protein